MSTNSSDENKELTLGLEDPRHPNHLKLNCFNFWVGNIPDGYTGTILNTRDTIGFLVNRKLHREDGPAVVRTNGTVEYWIEGRCLTKDEWEKEVAKRKPKQATPTGNPLKSYKNYKDLYLECTGNSTKGNDGKFLVEETQEEVAVVNGVITAIVSVEKDAKTGKPKHSHSFPLTDNVRYVFQSSVEANNVSKHVSEVHNYWIRDEKKVVCQSFKNVTKIPYMVRADWDELKDRFIRQKFILEDENVVVSTENNNIRCIESLTNGHFVSFPNDGTVTFGNLAVKLSELKDELTYVKVTSWEEKLKTDFSGVVIDYYGYVAHFKNGKCHREDGPALINTKNDKQLYKEYWFKDGMIHREDGPYAVGLDGKEYYALNDRSYYENKGLWERDVKRLQEERKLTVVDNHDRWTNIPTKDFTGVIKTKSKTVAYYKNGKLHRETGPAVVFNNNNEPKGNVEYWLNGTSYSKTDWTEQMEKLEEEQPKQEENEEVILTPEGHLKVQRWNTFKGIDSFTGSVIDEDGIICYYKNGVQHRDGNQPSFINKIGKDYRVNGKLHRTNGPAIEYNVGDAGPAFYLNGEKVSEFELYTRFPWKVSELGEKPKNFNGTVDYGLGVKETFKNGQLHSFDDKPAHTNGVEYQCWYKEGKRHRIGGPARIVNNTEEYWVEGKLYTKEEYWMQFPWDEATQGYPNDSFTGTVKRKGGDVETWLNGAYHSFDDKPSYISADGTVKIWHKKGNWHRETGPAQTNAKTSEETFYIDGKKTSKDEYYFKYPLKVNDFTEIPNDFTGIAIDSDGVIRYKKNGKYHRLDGPAWENKKTGIYEWYKDGVVHREDDEPARVCLNGTKCWYKEGNQHRENGPAVVYPSGKVEFWWEGRKYQSPEAYYTEHPLKLKNGQYVPAGFTGVAEWENGIIRHYKVGEVHREDGPAFLNPNGLDGYIKEGWYKNGAAHREGGPAIIGNGGNVEYYWEGTKYKDAQSYYLEHPLVLQDEKMFNDVPVDFTGKAKLKKLGIYKTYLNGKVHSFDDKPAISGDDGESWWKEGNLHREDGPAYVNDAGDEEYYWEGKKYNNATEFYLEHPKKINSFAVVEYGVTDTNARLMDKYSTFSGAISDSIRTVTYRNGKRHSYNDKPAWTSTEKPNNFSWWKDGKRHRENGPAHIKDGVEIYYWEGTRYDSAEAFYEEHPLKLSAGEHNDVPVNFTGKAVWEKEGVTTWYKDGKLHRDGDLPAFVSSMEVSWFKEGKYHREGNRHAQIQPNGFKGFYVNNRLHREDGPAYEAGKFSRYYLSGISYKSKEHWQKAKYQLGIDKVPYSVVDEAKQEIGYRVARKQLVTITRKFLAEQVSNKAGGTAKQKETAYSSALEFLSSELGTSVVYGAVGLLLPKLEPSLPERFRVHLDKLSKEFRVSAMASVGVEVADLLASTVGKALKNLPSSETYSLGSVSLKEKTITTTTTLEKEIVYEQHANGNKVQSN